MYFIKKKDISRCLQQQNAALHKCKLGYFPTPRRAVCIMLDLYNTLVSACNPNRPKMPAKCTEHSKATFKKKPFFVIVLKKSRLLYGRTAPTFSHKSLNHFLSKNGQIRMKGAIFLS